MADVCTHYLPEEGLQAAAGLPATATQIQRTVMAGALVGQPLEQGNGVGGAKLLVLTAALKQRFSH